MNPPSTIFITTQNLRDSICQHIPKDNAHLIVGTFKNHASHQHSLIVLPGAKMEGYNSIGFTCDFCDVLNNTPMRWHCSICSFDLCHICINDPVRGIPSPLAYTVLPSNWISHSHAFEQSSEIHIIPHQTSDTIPFFQELVSQHKYFDQASIFRYTTNDYKKLNIQMACCQLDDDQLAWAKQLYGACAAAKDEQLQNLPKLVFRKMFMSHIEFEAYRIGEKFYLPSFTSTSAKQLDWKGNTWVYISLQPEITQHAAEISTYSQYPTEEEILLNACTRFQVVSKIAINDGDKYYYLHLLFCD
jgi:hypothetical protein